MAALAHGASASAQLPVTRLLSVFPAGGQIGTTFEVEVAGSDLEEASHLEFFPPHFTALPKTEGDNKKPVANRFLVTIPSNATPRAFEVRVRGRHGLSNPRAFIVGDKPVFVSILTNAAEASAQPILDAGVITGRTRAEGWDYYLIKSKTGSRTVCWCEVREIDSRADPVIELVDRGGRKLARAERDSSINYNPTQDSEIFLRIRDFQYRGGEAFGYRLHVSHGPRVEFVMPPVGPIGVSRRIALFGQNLGAAASLGKDSATTPRLERIEVDHTILPNGGMSSLAGMALRPAAAFFDFVPFHWPLAASETATEAPNAVRLGTSAVPITELSPTEWSVSSNRSPIRIQLPCEIAGVLPQRGHEFVAEFEAKKGDSWWIEMGSERLGAPADPAAQLQFLRPGKEGQPSVEDLKELQDLEIEGSTADFRLDSRDFAWRFSPSADGTYRLRWWDQYAQSKPDPRRAYRLSIKPATPDFRMVTFTQQPPPPNRDQRIARPWSLVARAGETIPLRVLALRSGGLENEIEIDVEGLPEGVTCSGWKIEAKRNAATVLLSVPTNAVSWHGAIRVIGRARLGTNEMRHESRHGNVVWPVDDYNNERVWSRLIESLQFTVLGEQTAPLRLETEMPGPFVAKAGAKISIPLLVARQSEFDPAFGIKAFGLKEWDQLPEVRVDPKTNRLVFELDLAKAKLPPGRYRTAFTGQASGRYKPYAPGLAAAQTEVKQAEAETKQAAEKETDEKKKALAEKLQSATTRLKELEKAAEAKDVTVTVYSTPVWVEVIAQEK